MSISVPVCGDVGYARLASGDADNRLISGDAGGGVVICTDCTDWAETVRWCLGVAIIKGSSLLSAGRGGLAVGEPAT
jgi:hypothetical protein